VGHNMNLKLRFLVLLVSSLFFSVSYAEDWLCVDNDSVYKVKIGDDVISFEDPRRESNPVFKVLKNNSRDDIVFAVRPFEIGAGLSEKKCRVCLRGDVVTLDLEDKKVYWSHIMYGYGDDPFVTDSFDVVGSEAYRPFPLVYVHKCQLAFE
jgi:hypothetical protein